MAGKFRKLVSGAVLAALAIGGPQPAGAQVDTHSPILNLLLMANGNDASTWGTNTNNNLTILENALSGLTTISVTGGALTLSQAQFGSGAVVFMGTLTTNEVVTLPAEPRYFVIENATTGAFTLTVQAGVGGTPLTVPQSTSIVHVYWSDGSIVRDVSSDGLAPLTANTVSANIGSGPAAVPFSSFLLALGLSPTSTPAFASVTLSAAAGTFRGDTAQTAGSARWAWGANTAAESGSNAGSDWELDAYSDAGSFLGTWMKFTRATGAATMTGPLAVTNQVTAQGVQLNPPMDGEFKRLKISTTGNTTLNVSADAFTAYDGTNVKTFRSLSVTGAVTSSAGAINQMDTGGPGTNRWLQVWAVGNGATGATGVVITQAADPTPPSPLPTGYTFYARAGSVKIDGSSNLYASIQRGNRGNWVVGGGGIPNLPIISNANTGNINTPTWTPFAVQASTGATPLAIVPPTATSISIVLSDVGGNQTTTVAPNSSYGAYNSSTNPPPFVVTSVNTNLSGDIVLESSSIYVISSNYTSGVVAARGWVDSVNAP